jgi:branched-chain amino acid transport system substrate-binding protein
MSEETMRRLPLFLALLCAMALAALLGHNALALDIKLGVLTDLTGPYVDSSGKGAVVATEMAVEDNKELLAGHHVTVISADHQSKADIGASIARQWLDRENVDAIVNVPNSAIGLAVQQVTRERKKIFLITGAASDDLTGKACSPTTAHWTEDAYALAAGVTKSVLKQGGDTWFFITADYAFGHAVQAQATKFIEQGGGKVIGSVRHPVGETDQASFMLQAMASGAKVIAFANGGTDTVNSLKQAHEFHVGQDGKQRIAGVGLFITDAHAVGLEIAQGLTFVTGFYWDQNDATRAWSKRYFARMGAMPTREHAETYAAVNHYLKSVVAEGSTDGMRVITRMKSMPVNDFMATNGVLRADGRMMSRVYLAQVKKPEESKYPWDYYRILAEIAPGDAFRPLDEGNCPFIK